MDQLFAQVLDVGIDEIKAVEHIGLVPRQVFGDAFLTQHPVAVGQEVEQQTIFRTRQIERMLVDLHLLFVHPYTDLIKFYALLSVKLLAPQQRFDAGVEFG